jgi:hypothetical protein
MMGAERGRNDQRCEILPDRLRARVTEHPLRRGIELGDVPVVIHRDDRVECGVENRARARLLRDDLPLNLLARHEVADLPADARHQRQQVVVHGGDGHAVELRYAQNLVVAQNREPERAMQPGCLGGRRARKVRIDDHVLDPRWRACRPHSPRQSGAGRKRGGPRYRKKRGRGALVLGPRGDAPQERAIGIKEPEQPTLPSEIRADRAEHVRRARLQGRSRSDGATGRVGRGPPALEDAAL